MTLPDSNSQEGGKVEAAAGKDGPPSWRDRYISAGAQTTQDQRGEPCPTCYGWGDVGGLTPNGYESDTCPDCHGSGHSPTPSQEGRSSLSVEGLSDERILHLWDIHVGYETGTNASKKLPLGRPDKLAFARAVITAAKEQA